jgi:hypothetical protein
MMKLVPLMLALTSLAPVPALAAAPTENPAPSAAVDKLATGFFELLKAGKSQEAVNFTATGSPLMAGRAADQMNLTGQIDTALRLYGPIQSYEMVNETVLGTSYVKRHYIVRHANMLTRWEFEFGRLKDGWSFIYFGFEDQVRTWG